MSKYYKTTQNYTNYINNTLSPFINPFNIEMNLLSLQVLQERAENGSISNLSTINEQLIEILEKYAKEWHSVYLEVLEQEIVLFYDINDNKAKMKKLYIVNNEYLTE